MKGTSEVTTPDMTPPFASDLQHVYEDVKLLQTEVAKLKAEAASGWKKLGVVLGICGGILGILSTLIAFPKSIQEAKDELFARSDIAVQSHDMAVAYEPGDSTFTLKFPILLVNDGNKSGFIRDADSELLYSPNSDPQKIEEDFTQGFHAGSGQFRLYSKGSIDGVSASDVVPLPLSVGKQSDQPIFFSILFDKGTFTKAGFNRLNVDLIPQEGKKQRFSFCFFLDDQEIQDLQQSRVGGRKRFLTPTCEG